MQELNKKIDYKEAILLILMYALLYVFYFNIQFENISTALLYDGKYDDILQVYWNTWHFKYQLQHASNPFVSTFQLFPNEISLWMHAYTPFFGLLNILFNNPVLAINVGLIVVFILGSYYAYILAGLFIEKKGYRFLASTFYMFNLYTINKIGVHYNLVLICLSPILIYSILRAIEVTEQKIILHRKYIIQTGLLILLNFIFDYYALFYALSFGILYVVYFKFFKTWIEKFNWKKLSFLALIILLMHIIIRLLRISGVSEKGALWSAADTRSFIMPSTLIYPDWLRLQVDLLAEHSLFIGYALLVVFVVVLFFKNKDKNTGFFLFALIVYAMVCSPIIRINNKDLFFLPTGIIHFIPFVNNVRNPSRFLEMLFMILPIFIFRKIELNKSRFAMGLSIGLFLLMSIEQKLYANVYLNTKNIDKEKYLSSYIIKEKISEGDGILTIPFGVRDGFEEIGDFDEEVYIEQSIHLLKTSSGYYSRVPKVIWENYKNNEFYTALVAAQNDSLVTITSSKMVEDFINNSSVKAVFINKQYLEERKNLMVFLDEVFPKGKYKREEFGGKVLIYLN